MALDLSLAISAQRASHGNMVGMVELRWGNHDATFRGLLDGRTVGLSALPAGARTYQPLGAGAARVALDTLHVNAPPDPHMPGRLR